MKLNGWQRLWVVATLIIFVIAVFYTIVLLLPEKSEIMSRWACETIEAARKTKEYSEEHSPKLQDAFFKLDLEVALSELRDARRGYGDKVLGYGYKELIDKIHEKYVEKNPLTKIKFDEIDKRYRNELDTLPIKRAKHALIVFAIYLCLISAIYGVGRSIGWVYRGFRTKESRL
jgi:hypothetical protein